MDHHGNHDHDGLVFGRGRQDDDYHPLVFTTTKRRENERIISCCDCDQRQRQRQRQTSTTTTTAAATTTSCWQNISFLRWSSFYFTLFVIKNERSRRCRGNRHRLRFSWCGSTSSVRTVGVLLLIIVVCFVSMLHTTNIAGTTCSRRRIFFVSGLVPSYSPNQLRALIGSSSTTSTTLLQKVVDDPALLTTSHVENKNGSRSKSDYNVVDDYSMPTKRAQRSRSYNREEQQQQQMNNIGFNTKKSKEERHTRSVLEAIRDPLVVVDHPNDSSSSSSSNNNNKTNNNSKKRTDWKRRHARSVLEGIRDISINPNDVRQVILEPASKSVLKPRDEKVNGSTSSSTSRSTQRIVNGAAAPSSPKPTTLGRNSTPYFASPASSSLNGSQSKDTKTLQKEEDIVNDDDDDDDELPVLPSGMLGTPPPPLANGVAVLSSRKSRKPEDDNTKKFQFPWDSNKNGQSETKKLQEKRRSQEEGGLFGFKFPSWDGSSSNIKNDFEERNRNESVKSGSGSSAAKETNDITSRLSIPSWNLKFPWDKNEEEPVVVPPVDESWKERVKWLSVPSLFRDVEMEADIIASQVITKTSDIMSRGLIEDEFNGSKTAFDQNATTTATTNQTLSTTGMANDEFDLLERGSNNDDDEYDESSSPLTRLTSSKETTKTSLTRRIRSLFQSRRQRRQQQQGITTMTEVDESKHKTKKKKRRFRRRANMERKFAARTVAGLIAALAEDVEDLRVEVLSSEESPMWRKVVDEVHISFTKLKFAPLKMRGPPLEPPTLEREKPSSSLQKLSKSLKGWESNLDVMEKKDLTKNLEMELDNETSSSSSSTLYNSHNGKSLTRNNIEQIGGETGTSTSSSIQQSRSSEQQQTRQRSSSSIPTADDMFDQMDIDNSGALDQDELFEALNLAMGEHEDTSILIGGTAEDDDIDSMKQGNSIADKQQQLSGSIGSTASRRRPRRRRSLWSRSRTDAVLERLAARLIKLYDQNGDGVVDRDEYRLMVADMAKLRRTRRQKQLLDVRRKASSTRRASSSNTKNRNDIPTTEGGFAKAFGRFVSSRLSRTTSSTSTRIAEDGTTDPSLDNDDLNDNDDNIDDENDDDSASLELLEVDQGETLEEAHSVRINYDDPVITGTESGEGSIVLENLKLDLRRLFFGAVPILKHLVPGGPLVLEPFTIKLSGSFNEADFKHSRLLEEGLKRLVARALRRRVRDIRDVIDGAVFFGRTWTMASREAPQVGFPTIENIEFDSQDRIIISGRAKIRSSPGAPEIENAFKLRTKFASGENGRRIRLDEPELALILECPKAWERNIVYSCKKLGLRIPRKPRPIYTYIPLASKLKVKDTDGFDLGEDNCLKRIQIRNRSLEIEMSSVLRPGRFLGNHYLAFSVPNRTFIITLDRVKEGIRAARQAKELLKLQRKERALIARGELDPLDAKYVVVKSPKEIEEESLKFEEAPPSRRRGPSRYTQSLNAQQTKGFEQSSKQWPSNQNTYYGASSSSSTRTVTKKKKQQQSVAKTIVVKRENVFSRFIRGYMSASQDFDDLLLLEQINETPKSRRNKQKKRVQEDEWNDRLTFALSEWFGRQDVSLKRLTLRDFEQSDDEEEDNDLLQSTTEDDIQTEIEQNLAKEAFEKILPVGDRGETLVDADPSKEVIVTKNNDRINGEHSQRPTSSTTSRTTSGLI